MALQSNPKLSYAAKTFLLEILPDKVSRRDFLRQAIVTVAGVSFLCISYSNNADAGSRFVPPSDINCGCYSDCHGQCYSNCYCACHGNCGRKSW